MSGTVIRLPERPFPIMWEQSPEADGCAHVWDEVWAESRPEHFEVVSRCEKCHTPRCDRLDDRRSKCIERRHHSTLHIFESGVFEPVGGYLRDDPQSTDTTKDANA